MFKCTLKQSDLCIFTFKVIVLSMSAGFQTIASKYMYMYMYLSLFTCNHVIGNEMNQWL